jgi:hypothetical protein
MKRRSNGKKKHHVKKRRSNGHGHRKHAAPARRRRRRNDETAAPAKKQRAPRRSADQIIADLEAKLARTKLRAEGKVAEAKAETAKAKAKVQPTKKHIRDLRSKGARLRRVTAAVRKDRSLLATLEPAMARIVEREIAKKAKPRAKRKSKRTQNWYHAKGILKKGSKASKGQKAIARAWRSAKRAQKLAVSPREQKLLRAMGLAGVPNPGMGGMFKDIGALLPQMGVSAASLAIAAVAGQMVASKLVPADKQDSLLGKAAPSVISLGVGLAGYMALRKSKSMGKFAPWVLAGGVAAAAVHAIARIKVKDAQGAEVTLGKRLGLPIGEYASMAGYGEYASMAGFGEYASMAGGTAYAGERGVFAGLDDKDVILSGTDDEDEVDMIETDADEGDNTDEGSLNGSIFD